MATFIPKNNNGFNWHTANSIYFKGYFFNSENILFYEDSAIEYLNKITCEQDFIKCLKSINGIFSIVKITSNKCYIASDNSCVFPIFYTSHKNELILSDDLIFLKNYTSNCQLDEKSINSFKGYGHTIGKKTLIKYIYQLQSSEFIIFKESDIYKSGFYFTLAVKKYSDASYEFLKSNIVDAFQNSFNRLQNSLQGQTIVLPLSGGYDSRLIAVMLKKHNFKDVICFTYGKKNSIDMKFSKKVANALNYKWHFIEYSDNLIEGYLKTDIFKKYCDSNFNYSTMLFMQEYFAVKYLKDNNLIPSNSVFIPGHDGGALGGGYLIKTISLSLKSSELPAEIYKNCIYSKSKQSQKFNSLNELKKTLERYNSNYQKLTPQSVFEDFLFKETTSKVIINSSKVYNYFGFQLRLPFCDIELQETFKHIPISLKENKNIYIDAISGFFEQYNLNFKKEMHPSLFIIYKQQFKNKLKFFFPNIILRKFLLKNDWLNSEKITNEMLLSMEKNKLSFNSKIKSFNEINIQWYLYYCQGLIKK